MAALNFNGPLAINMNVGDLVRFNTVEAASATSWSWITPEGTDVDVEGSGMTFDADGHATGGTVNTVKIDVGNNDFGNPNIEITGLNISAAALNDSPEAFWAAVLGGSDNIAGPTLAEVGNTGTSQMFGDGISAATGSSQGGNDFINLFDASITAVGDTTFVGANSLNGGLAILTGGDDQLFIGQAGEFQSISGDASSVLASGALFGGDDFLQISNSNANSRAVGDAIVVQGIAGRVGFVEGGNDTIVAVGVSTAELIGDVREAGSHATVVGGDDDVSGSEQGELISGDVGFISSTTVQSFVGGNDVLDGNGGSDIISGDAGGAVFGARITGGNDTIHGGTAGDRILGEVNSFDLSQVKGGNDFLFGDAGDDFVFGQTGDDRLNGGTGTDLLDGGTGRDRLAGGGGDDTFVFRAGGEIDRVLDFEDGVDDLNLAGFDFNSFAELKALATNTAGGDLRIAFGGGDVLVIDDFSRAEFTANDVLFEI